MKTDRADSIVNHPIRRFAWTNHTYFQNNPAWQAVVPLHLVYHGGKGGSEIGMWLRYWAIRAADMHGLGSSPRREIVNICTDF